MTRHASHCVPHHCSAMLVLEWDAGPDQVGGRVQAGHAIQEDEPARTAEVLLNFLQRFRIGQPKQAIPRPAAAGIVLPVAAGPVLATPQR